MTLQKLARWHPSQSTTVHDRKGSAALWEGSLEPLEHEDLKQGALYIIKIHHVSVGLFQGWNDDMCCFAVLRSENVPMRWSQARYLPGDYDAYDAFDEAGNPPVHLWTRYLRVEVPINWFAIFEEARRKQREWTTHVLGQQQQQQRQQQQQQQQHHHHHHAPIHDLMPMTTSSAATTDLTTGLGMMGGTGDGVVGGFPPPPPPLVTAMHQHQPNILDEDYSDHGTFSAAPSPRSERLSSISSLPPTSPRHAYSPPQSPTPSDVSASRYPPLALTSDPPSSSSFPQPVTATTTASKEDPLKQQHNVPNIASSSSPTITSTGKTGISPPVPTTTTTKPAKRRSTAGATPSQQLELALGNLNFPHDDDRFSIHSGYQSASAAGSVPASPTHPPPATNTWKKRSIKRMLGRSSNSTK
ncbi:hypothetical protein [Absidia glauca]|uniref:Uncharacterized protein n=1 Tax=Absidia glauca TaxID=4829 RepID=A0A163LTS0_ABSGL|nr:hypothetical protein [Absidia glauca]